MFYYKFTASTNFCGTEDEEYHKFEVKPKPEELNELAEQIARENAESYEYLMTGWDNEDVEGMSEDEIEELLNNYYADASCSYEEITEEEYNEEMGAD